MALCKSNLKKKLLSRQGQVSQPVQHSSATITESSTADPPVGFIVCNHHSLPPSAGEQCLVQYYPLEVQSQQAGPIEDEFQHGKWFNPQALQTFSTPNPVLQAEPILCRVADETASKVPPPQQISARRHLKLCKKSRSQAVWLKPLRARNHEPSLR